MDFGSFIDDSGSHKDSSVFILAGCLAPAKDWSKWYSQWKQVLDRPNGHKPIEYFHAVDAAHSRGQFWGWKKDESNLFPLRLIPAIESNKIWKFAAAVGMDAFHRTIKGQVLDQVKSPYYLCMLMCMVMVADFMRRSGAPRKERVAYVFEEQNKFAPHALELYNDIKSVKENERKYKLGSIAFDSKKGSPMLQAADLVAYESYGRMKEILGIRKLEYPQRYQAISARNFGSCFFDQEALEKVASDPNAFIDYKANA